MSKIEEPTRMPLWPLLRGWGHLGLGMGEVGSTVILYSHGAGAPNLHVHHGGGKLESLGSVVKIEIGSISDFVI